MNTWSRFVVNLPFSRLVLLAGEPVEVPSDADPQLMEAKRLQLETRINELVEHGHHLVGADFALGDVPKVGRAPEPGLLLKAYRGGMRIAQPLARPILQRRVRRGKEDLLRMNERFGKAGLRRPEGDLVWFHAASVGETVAVLPLIASLGKQRPSLIILLTTGTVTSSKIAADRLPDGVLHQFVPLDGPGFVNRFLDHWRPDLAVLVESEIWPNLVLETAARKIPLVLVNATMSLASYRRWRRWAGLSRALFGRFDLILVQNNRLQKRFAMLGAPRVMVVGNMKSDAPPLPVDEKKKQELSARIGSRRFFLAASTHKGEEEQILQAHEKLCRRFPDLLTIIVPRHPERGGLVAELAVKAGFSVAQRSKGEQPDRDIQVYVADTLGELGMFFDLSQLVFLGGSLVPAGGHNPFEPLQFDSVVITGPHWHNQSDSFDALLSGRGALEVASGAELAQCVEHLMRSKEEGKEIALRARKILDEMTGATARTLAELLPLLPETEESRGK